MSLALWLLIAPSFALDINDHLVLGLHGGEEVDGWYLRADGSTVVLSIPALGERVRVPLSIVDTVNVNDADMSVGDFQIEVELAWAKHTRWLADPPPHPPPLIVGVSGVFLAGLGHASLGEWAVATPMLVADGMFMGVMALEATGHGTGRMDVFLSAAFLSVLFKSYAVSDGYRLARRRRVRLGLGRPFDENSPS